MQLREVIGEIIKRKFSTVPETQRPRALAQVLTIGEMDARRLMEAGRNQEKQFSIFLKLLPLCRELKIDLTCGLDPVLILTGEIADATTRKILHKETRGTQRPGKKAGKG